MGKIRIKTIGDEEQELKQKEKKNRKRAEKKAREAADQEQTNEPEASNEKPVDQHEAGLPSEAEAKAGPAPEEHTETKQPKKTKKAKFAKKARGRSSNYTAKVMDVDKNKTYSLSEALELLKKVNLAKFDETVELHINTIEAGINGTVKLPHGTGKELRIAVADDTVISEVEKGKINFDILIAEPSMMPKLARVAKVLGPKGLMPNPKNGTISDNPQEAMKKFEGGQISFKTESKVPLMHLTVGKMSFGTEKLSENIKTIIGAVKKDRITQIVLKSTMSPAIKLQV